MLNKSTILAAFSEAGITPSAKTNKDLIHEFLSKNNRTVVDDWEIENSYNVIRTENIDSSSESVRRRFLSGYYHRKEAVCAQYAFNGCHCIFIKNHEDFCIVHAYERDSATLKLKWLCGANPETLNPELIYHIADCHILVENEPHVVALRKKLLGDKEPFRNLETGLLTGDLPESYYLSEDGKPYPFKFIIVCNDIFKKNGIPTERSGILNDFIPKTKVCTTLANSKIKDKTSEEPVYCFSLTLNPFDVELSPSLNGIHSDIHPRIVSSQVSGIRYMFNEPLDFKKNFALKRRLMLQ